MTKCNTGLGCVRNTVHLNQQCTWNKWTFEPVAFNIQKQLWVKMLWERCQTPWRGWSWGFCIALLLSHTFPYLTVAWKCWEPSDQCQWSLCGQKAAYLLPFLDLCPLRINPIRMNKYSLVIEVFLIFPLTSSAECVLGSAFAAACSACAQSCARCNFRK